MKASWFRIAAGFLLLVAGCGTLASDLTMELSKKVTAGAAKVAEESLKQMAASSPRNLGLAGDEAATARLGIPLREYVVQFDELGPAPPLHGGTTVLFPVMVSGQARSLLRVKEADTQPALSGLGEATLMKLVADVIGHDRLAAGNPVGCAVIQVPALSLCFVGRQKDGKLELAPVQDAPLYELRLGRFEPGSEVFTRLKLKAKPDGAVSN